MNIKQLLKYGPFDIWGGGGAAGIVLKKKKCLFPYRSEKKQNVFNKVKNKFVLHSVNVFKTLSLGAITVCK